MKDYAIAARYAKALFEFAAQLKAETKIENELKVFLAGIHDRKELGDFFRNPIIPFSEKKALLEKTLGGKMAALTVQFISLALEKGRFSILNQITDAYHELLNASNHFEEVIITTAKPLNLAVQNRLEKVLEKKIGEKIVSIVKTDPEILGGIHVQIRHRLFDGSIKSKLDSLQQQMIGSAS